MSPIDFPEKTKVLSRPETMTEEECSPLSVWNADGVRCISCWRPTWRERLSILVFGRVWCHVWFGASQPPIALDGKRTVFVRDRNQGGGA